MAEGWRGVFRAGQEGPQPRCRRIGARASRTRDGKDPPDRPGACRDRL